MSTAASEHEPQVGEVVLGVQLRMVAQIGHVLFHEWDQFIGIRGDVGGIARRGVERAVFFHHPQRALYRDYLIGIEQIILFHQQRLRFGLVAFRLLGFFSALIFSHQSFDYTLQRWINLISLELAGNYPLYSCFSKCSVNLAVISSTELNSIKTLLINRKDSEGLDPER